MRDCHVYILYVLTNGAPWPSDGGRKRPVQKPAWPRGQPRKRRLEDPDDVGAARDPFPCVREQFPFLFPFLFFLFSFSSPFQSDRGLCLSQSTRSRYLFQKKRKRKFLSSRLAPRPFFCKTRGGAGRPTRTHARTHARTHTHTHTHKHLTTNETENEKKRKR